MLKRLQRHLRHPAYPALVAVLAGADIFCLCVPTDALLMAAAAARPRRWWSSALLVAAGSTAGAALFALLLAHYHPWLAHHFPALAAAPAAVPAGYGALRRYAEATLFFGAVGPLPLSPFVLGAALSGASLPKLTLVVFVGRALKYLAFAAVSAFAPRLRAYLSVGRLRTAPALSTSVVDKQVFSTQARA